MQMFLERYRALALAVGVRTTEKAPPRKHSYKAPSTIPPVPGKKGGGGRRGLWANCNVAQICLSSTQET